MISPTTEEKLDEALARLRRMEDLWLTLLGPKRKSLEAQAKEAGVSRTTLWRRQKREKLRRMVNGN